MELKNKTRIFIIESPSETDIHDDRKEGLALSEMLKLADIENEYFRVSNKVTFSECLAKIVQIEGKKERFPTLHFSFHGNENVIALTNQEFLTLQELYE